MTDSLFPEEPISQGPRLAVLRRQYEDAQIAYEEASRIEDETGEPVPPCISRAYRNAERLLGEAERQAVKNS